MKTKTRAKMTLARRRCAGCRRTTALQLWPWNGRILVTTHGLCRRCRRTIDDRHALRVSTWVPPERCVVSDLLN